MEVICAILEEKISWEAEIKRAFSYIYGKDHLKAEYTIHIEVHNPFWASVGLSIEPLYWKRSAV